MIASVEALLCDETEAGGQGRQSRLFFPGGLEKLPGKLGNLPGKLGNLSCGLGNLPGGPRNLTCGLGNLPEGLGILPGGGLGNLPNSLQTLGLTFFEPNSALKTTAAPANITAVPTTTTTATTASAAAQITALEAKAKLLEDNINSLKEAKAAVEMTVAAARRRKRAVATTCSGFISLVSTRKKFLVPKLHGDMEIFQLQGWILRAKGLLLLLMTLLNLLLLPVLLKKR